eukprot:2513578-Prymnesium_polylepis.1
MLKPYVDRRQARSEDPGRAALEKHLGTGVSFRGRWFTWTRSAAYALRLTRLADLHSLSGLTPHTSHETRATSCCAVKCIFWGLVPTSVQFDNAQ